MRSEDARGKPVWAILSAAFTPMVVFLLVPAGVILRNLKEVPYDPKLAALFGLAFLGAFLLSAPVFLLAGRRRLFSFFARTALLAGLSILLWDALAPLLAGRRLMISATLELLPVLAACWLLFRLRFPTLFLVFGVMTPVMLASAAADHYRRASRNIERMTGGQASERPWDPPLSWMIGQESEEVKDAFAYDRALVVPGAEVEWGPRMRVRTLDRQSAYALLLPFRPIDPPPNASYLHLRVQVDRGRVELGVLSEDQKEWLPGTIRRLKQGESPEDVYIKLPQVGLGPLVVANASDNGGRSELTIEAPARRILKSGVRAGASGNVYHVLVDSYQREAYEFLAGSKPDNALPLTYFPDFRVNSGRTRTSTAEMFTGRFYTSEVEATSWPVEAIREGMLRSLVRSGISLHLYPHYRYYCHPEATTCTTNLDVKKGVLRGLSGDRAIIDLWFLRLLPTSLRRLLNAELMARRNLGAVKDWDYGFSLMDTLTETPEGGNQPKDTDNPFFSVSHFERFLEDESSRPASGQYIFLHLILPHDPLILDSGCGYAGPRPGDQLGRYLSQVECTNLLMHRLLSRLDDLGRLEHSLVLIHSDHGNYWHPKEMGFLREFQQIKAKGVRLNSDKVDSRKWTPAMIETRSAALLLAGGLFDGPNPAVSHLPVQMIDIAPTVLNYFGIAADSPDGVPIQQMPEDFSRDWVFIANDRKNPVFSWYRRQGGQWTLEKTTGAEGDR